MPSGNNLLKLAQVNISTLLFASAISTLKRIKMPIRSHIVETNTANFLLLMGVHGVGKFGQEINIENEIDTLDAVFLETGSFHYLKNGRHEFLFPENRFDEMAFYHKLIPLLRKKHIPMLFGDLPFSTNAGLVLSLLDGLITIGAVILGAKFAFSKNLRKGFAPILGTSLGLWGTLGMIKRVALIDSDLIRSEKYKNIRKAAFVTEVIHPQDILGIFRNALIAIKLLSYAQSFKSLTGRKPTIAIAMGSGHELISEYLKQGEDFCQKILNRYPLFIKKLLLPPGLRNYYPALVEAIYNDNQYQVKISINSYLKKDIFQA